jgi:hypothetical protein
VIAHGRFSEVSLNDPQTGAAALAANPVIVRLVVYRVEVFATEGKTRKTDRRVWSCLESAPAQDRDQTPEFFKIETFESITW